MNGNLTIKRIKETKTVLEEANTNDEKYLTILLNSLLSLVILPTEELKRKPRQKVFGSNMSTFLKSTGVVPIKFDPIKDYKDKKVVHYNRTPQKFVEKLRNGIAHQCIKINEFEGKSYIVIYNVFDRNKYKAIDFETKLSVVELKKLALYIANCYLNIGR